MFTLKTVQMHCDSPRLGRQGLRLVGLMLFGMLCSAHALPLAISPLFGDHAVLQRGRPVAVWGEGEPGAALTLSFGDQSKETVVGADGRWRVELAPLPPSVVGRDLVARIGKDTLVVRDVVVGEVWLCSGQSNMARTLTADYDVGETGSPDRPLVRQFMVGYAAAEAPVDQVSGAWTACTPETIAGFSAVAYYFASEVSERLQVPVGVVVSAVGGTRIEAWMPADALAVASFAEVRAKWDRYLTDLPTAMAAYEKDYAQWQQDAEAARVAGKEFTVRRPFPPLGSGSKLALSALFNGMIHPLLDFQARGVLWYQGEYNTREPSGYDDLFAALIRSWRHAFGDEARPFYWVQLANHERPGDMPGSWARLRDAQTKTLDLPHTGQAVAIDIGEAGDIHPRNKWDVGDRLARIALAQDYGVAVAWRGPSFARAVRDGAVVQVDFDHAAGLHSRGGDVEALELAGADGVFHPARAQVLRSAVRVSSPEVSAPVAVRYAWSNAPRANLYNRAGLPAVPFTAVVDTGATLPEQTRN